MNVQRILLLTVGLALGFGFLLIDVAPAGAAGDAKKSAGGHGAPEEEEESDKDGPRPPLPWEIPRAIENRCTKEEIVVLRELRERSELLDLRGAALDERERGIEEAERLLAGRLAKIEAVRAEIVGKLDAERSTILATIREEQTSRRKEIEKEQSARLKKIEEEQSVVLAAIARDQQIKDERVLELAGIVATMKAKSAAAMLAGMDDNVALQVLLKLRPKTAGKILAAMPAVTAQDLGDKMTVHRDPRKALAAGAGTGSSGGVGLPGASDKLPPSPSAAPSGAPPETAVTPPTPTNN
jgi:flagellar motility protein MotE (MotC chaperone)